MTPQHEAQPACAVCGKSEEVYEEVDIGVGIQRFLVALECPEHGGICGFCNGCGVPSLDNRPCREPWMENPWCRDRKAAMARTGTGVL